MNRPGQPPQRPPSLGPAPGIGGPFRGPYPTYALPPRNIVPGYPAPGLQNHRTTQNLVPQPTPGAFVQPRTPGFPFGAANPQQQQQSQSQQTHPQLPLPPHQQQQPPASAHPSLSHLQSATPSIGGSTGGGGGTAPSVSSTSELGLDPNDFPALGATPSTANSASNPTPATSYASQAGTGLPPSGSSGAALGGSALPRDFTADDFPALGGGPAPSQQQQQQSSQQQPQPSSHDGHPPGLSGLPGNQQQQHQQQPGLLNLVPRALQGLQSESEKQRHTMKLNAAAVQAAWNQPNSSTTQGQTQTYQNGTQQQPQQSLHAPPGVPPPSSFSQQATQQSQSQAQGQGTPFVGNGNGNGNGTPTTGNGGNGAGADAQGQSASAPAPVPQTPAQQVLMSAADRWGLLGLLAMIKSADPDQALLSVGTDLGTMGLDMQQQGNLYSTFITPWADSSAAHTVEPDFHLPGCYNVQPPPPGPGKAAAFSDETLFFMFYSSPRDALQEIAAQELYNRNWRYHKELRIWLTKESGTAPSQKVPGGEQGTYTFWDPDNWGKERKEMIVLYADLEEKSLTAPPSATFAPGSVQQQAPPQLQQIQMGQMGQMGQLGQVQPQVRGAFQGVSMAAM